MRVVTGGAPGPAGFEDHGGEHPGQDRRLGVREHLGAQGLGDEEVGLVVDPAQASPGRGEGPAVDVPELLEDVDPMAQLGREQIGPPGLPLGERTLEDGLGRRAVEAADQVDGQVVGGPEGGAQVRGWGGRHPRRLGEVDLARPDHHGMALLVEPTPSRPTRELEVLARGQGGTPGTAVLGEPLDDHRTCRHVDAQREGLGGEDHLQQAGGETLLHRLAEHRDEAGVVGGDASLEPFKPFVEAEGPEVLVAQRRRATLSDGPDGGPLPRVGEAHPVAHHLANGVVARGPAEDEHDGRQQSSR